MGVVVEIGDPQCHVRTTWEPATHSLVPRYLLCEYVLNLILAFPTGTESVGLGALHGAGDSLQWQVLHIPRQTVLRPVINLGRAGDTEGVRPPSGRAPVGLEHGRPVDQRFIARLYPRRHHHAVPQHAGVACKGPLASPPRSRAGPGSSTSSSTPGTRRPCATPRTT